MVAEGFNPRIQWTPALKAGLPSAATPWLNPQTFGNSVLVQRWRSFDTLGLALRPVGTVDLRAKKFMILPSKINGNLLGAYGTGKSIKTSLTLALTASLGQHRVPTANTSRDKHPSLWS